MVVALKATIAHSDKHINIKRKRRYQMFLEKIDR